MIAMGSDHGGFALKQAILTHLEAAGVTAVDFGSVDETPCDYPDIAREVCRQVQEGKASAAILVCGTGIGMSIAANKMRGIRAACCSDAYSAKFTRMHNDANVLCLGGRVVGEGLACELVDLFLQTPFEGGRHEGRLQKVAELEQENAAQELSD